MFLRPVLAWVRPPCYDRRMRRFPAIPAAVLMASLLAPSPGIAAGTLKARLPFIENGYAAALARARARGVPIFVEAWAPW